MRRLSSWYTHFQTLVTQAWVWLHTHALARSPAQGLVEYGLILVLIAVTCIGILSVVGKTVSGLWYQRIIDTFPT